MSELHLNKKERRIRFVLIELIDMRIIYLESKMILEQ